MSVCQRPNLVRSLNEFTWVKAELEMREKGVKQLALLNGESTNNVDWHFLLVKGVDVYRKTFCGSVCLNSTRT